MEASLKREGLFHCFLPDLSVGTIGYRKRKVTIPFEFCQFCIFNSIENVMLQCVF